MNVNVISESEFFPKAHGVHTAYVNNVAMLRAAGVTVSVNTRTKADITHIHTIGPYSLSYLLNNKPTVVTAHVIPDSFVGSFVGAKYWVGSSAKYLKFFYNRANLVLAVSPNTKDTLKKMGVTTRIEVFPNPVDIHDFAPKETLREEGRKLLGISKDAKVAISVGQIQTRKGVEDFIAVAKKLPEITFVWIGNQPFKKLLEEKESLKEAIINKPDNVLLPGVFSLEQMPALYNAADVFFFPSFQENAPLVVVEAGACGLPLVLRELDNYKNLYQEGYVGESSAEGFVKEIDKLFTDKAYFEKAQKDALALSKKFSFETLGKVLLGYYQTLLSDSHLSTASTNFSG